MSRAILYALALVCAALLGAGIGLWSAASALRTLAEIFGTAAP